MKFLISTAVLFIASISINVSADDLKADTDLCSNLNVPQLVSELNLVRVDDVRSNKGYKITRGSVPDTEADMQFLKCVKKIDTIVNLEMGVLDADRVANEERLAEKYGVTVLRAPIQGSRIKPSVDSVNRALGYLRDPSLGRIYVHCALGRDRTGMVVALHQIYDDNFSVDYAEKYMQAFGFPMSGLKKFTLKGIVDYFNEHKYKSTEAI